MISIGEYYTPPHPLDLPTALKSITTQVCKAASARDNDYGEN